MTDEITLEDWLVDRGHTPQQAELWCDFISDSIDLFDDGHALLCTTAEWASFLTGCNAAHPTEPEITSGLGDRMRRLQHEAPMDSNRDKLQVAYEVAPIGDESHGIRKPKADFEIRRKFEAGYSASFVVEAKPLRTSGDMNNRYLGTEGIGCFLERDPPYSRDTIVGMVGYALKGYSKWFPLLASIPSISGINKVFLQSGKSCLVSEHERKALKLPNATVTHTILNYT